MSKWTLQLLRENFNNISTFKNEFGKVLLLKCVNCECISGIDRHGTTSTYGNFSEFEFYDSNMNLIEPPKEREFDVFCEYFDTDFSVYLDEEFTSRDDKLPNGRRYKRYKDNGELEVFDENN